jgi:hypothetical protein
VAELVDALDLGSSDANRGGSNPSARTTVRKDHYREAVADEGLVVDRTKPDREAVADEGLVVDRTKPAIAGSRDGMPDPVAGLARR